MPYDGAGESTAVAVSSTKSIFGPTALTAAWQNVAYFRARWETFPIPTATRVRVGVQWTLASEADKAALVFGVDVFGLRSAADLAAPVHADRFYLYGVDAFAGLDGSGLYVVHSEVYEVAYPFMLVQVGTSAASGSATFNLTVVELGF